MVLLRSWVSLVCLKLVLSSFVLRSCHAPSPSPSKKLLKKSLCETKMHLKRFQGKNKMNQEKLKQLQAQVRIGGKGTARRKKKVVHRTATTDDKKLQSSLKKLSVNNIPGIEEVNMIKDDGTVIHFNNPKVQASLAANTFAVTGHAENKQITEMLPGILNQLGAESLTHLKRLASNVTGGGTGAMEPGLEDDDDDEVPDLVENFDEVSKNEAATAEVIPEAAPAAEAKDDIETEEAQPDGEGQKEE